MNPGIYLFHKPVGPTSFSIVQTCLQSAIARPGKRPLRICHGGTLDPFASGLLLILVEPATKLFDYLHDIPKVYEATIRWGIETDNGDPLGKTIFSGEATNLSPAQLEESLAGFIGWREQVPHATSAKRIDGERAYLKAHRGETVVMPPSRVYLHEATWLSHDLPRQSKLRMTVRGGYYVRALARDLGRLLGCGAHLSELNRVSIGPWNDPGLDRTVELQSREILSWLPARILSDMEVGDLRRGLSIPIGEPSPADWNLPAGFPEPKQFIRGFHLERFCFLLESLEGQLRVVRPFHGGI
jgi:tRNA pseudouridine55 synthase